MSKLGIYVHIPFCVGKCPYCDFYSVTSDCEQRESFVRVLTDDIKENADKHDIVDSIYFGGGTPTTLSEKQLDSIMKAVKSSFVVSEDVEITIEANPCTVSEISFKGLRSIGFNRISFGVQSCVDDELRALGRLHSFAQAESCVRAACNAGFENISCDLMLGIIGQDIGSLKYSVDTLCSWPITHISAYMLSIEQGTPYDNDAVRSAIASEDTVADMYLYAVNRLNNNGFEQYEISNFCREDKYSRHNMKYWSREDYIGFGPSAHSFRNGKRYYYERDIEKYITDRKSILKIEDADCNVLEEYVMLSLRTCIGMDISKYIEYGGNEQKVSALSKELVKHGLAKNDGSHLKLTPKGFLVSNSIMTELM